MIDLFLNILIVAVTILTITCGSFYLYLKKQYKFWERLGIPGPKPEMVFGSMKDLLNLKITEAELAERWYQAYPDERYLGIYTLWKPGLFVKDIDLIKQIFVNNFEHFTDHPEIRGHSYTDSIFDSLFAMKGDVWKERRHFITKLFTPKKLKEYVENMNSSINSYLVNEIEKNLFKDHNLDYMMDILMVRIFCTILYGLDVSNDEDTVTNISNHSNEFSYPSKTTALKALFYTVSPKLCELFKIRIYPKCIWNYFSSLTKELITTRTQNETKRNDLVQLIIQMKETGIMKNGKISFEEAVGHVFILFMGAHHTIELSTSHVMLQLALHPEIQEKVRKEVDEILGGAEVITYDHLVKMTYFDCVVSETLRMFPLCGVLKRVCTKPYKLNDKFTIPKDMDIIIPARSIHMDPDFYPDPEIFHPERFLNGDLNTFTLMPFGKGPRICIGLRIAELAIKMVVAKTLSKYIILPSDKMKFPMEYNPQTIIITSRPIGGVWVKMKPRQ